MTDQEFAYTVTLMWLHEVDFHLAASAFMAGSAFTLSVLAVILYSGRKK